MRPLKVFVFVKADKSHFPLVLVFSFPFADTTRGTLAHSFRHFHSWLFGPVVFWPHHSGGEERQQKRKGKGKEKAGRGGQREGAGISAASPEAYPQMA